MRVIKFRAWDNQNKQMLDVQELNFEDCFYGGGMQIKTTMYNDYFDYREMPIMQYTGLHDKNGKEIYEGDIIQDAWRVNMVVKYINTGFYLCRKNINGEYTKISNWRDLQTKQVIGNIYENPDLLEVE